MKPNVYRSSLCYCVKSFSLLCQAVHEVRTGLFTIQMQNQVQEETTVAQNSDLSTGRSCMVVGKQANKIYYLKERKHFLVTCKCRK